MIADGSNNDYRRSHEDHPTTRPARRRRRPRPAGALRAGPDGGVQLQVREQPAGGASDERARQGDGRRHPRRHQGPRLDRDLPEQPARLGHRHAEPGALGRHRVLHPLRPDPLDPGAGRFHHRHRLRLQQLRRSVEGARRRPRRLCEEGDRQVGPGGDGPHLGQRLSPDHLVDQADQHRRRPEGLQDPRPGLAAVDLDVQGLRGLAGLDQLQRGLQRAAVEGRRRPGKSARHHRHGQALRSAEVLLAHQPHVGRLLVPGQRQGLGAAARRSCAPSSPGTSTMPA